MEIHQLRYFVAVAESGHFTRAAKREHVSQPALSHQILKLEHELGADLFNRTGKMVILTAAGKAFLPTAESVLRQLKEAQSQIREMAGIEGGRVRLGVIPSVAPFLLPNLLASFSKQHPSIEVAVIEEVAAALLEAIRDRTLDLAIMPLPQSAAGMICSELMRERLFAVVCEAHPLVKNKRVTPAQLAGLPFLLLKDGHCFRQNVLAMFERARVAPRIAFESGCFLTILNMVKASMGISVVPEMAVQNGTGCRFIPIEADQPVRIISLVELQGCRPTPARQLLADFIKRSHAVVESAHEVL